MEKNTATKKAQNFVRGAVIIAFAHLLIKIIGAVYKIPLDRYILHPVGMGYYDSVYTLYSLLFTISTAGIPTAISKMVSEAMAKNELGKVEKIFAASRILMIVIGLFGSAMLFFFASPIAREMGIEKAAVTIKVLSPALFFVCISSAYRGYYQGQENMTPTAVSEVFEALGKLLVGLALAYILAKTNIIYGVSGAIGGVVCGTAASALFLTIFGLRRKTRREKECSSTLRSIISKLVMIAVPITIGAAVFTLTNAIDTAMVIRQLNSIGFDGVKLKGYLSRAVTMFNMPPTIITSLAISVVPAISVSMTVGQKERANTITSSALRITTLISYPCAVGLSVLAKPILSVLYNDGSNSELLVIMGIAVAFVTVVQVGNAVLQAHGKVWQPVIFMAIGGAVKITANYILVSNPRFNISGAPVGTLLCYAAVMILDLIYIKKLTCVNYGWKDMFLKPGISALAMGASVYVCYSLINGISTLLALGVSIIIGIIVYFAFMFIINGIKGDDIKLLPAGGKICAYLKKLHLLR